MSEPTIKHNGWDFFIAQGKSNTGIVLVHEIFGLNHYARSVATELSKNQYWAAAIDIFEASSLPR